MATIKDTSIRVKESTRLRLDTLKGSQSYDALLSDILTYFETTGIMPKSMMVSPVVAVKEQASRVIEVVRGIEKSQKLTLKTILDLVNQIAAQQPTGHISNNTNPDEFMHITDVQALLSEAARLRHTNPQQNAELDKLRTQLEIAEKKAPSGSAASGNIASIKKTLLETVDLFDERKKSSTFNDDIYEFDRNGFDKWIARFRDDINKL